MDENASNQSPNKSVNTDFQLVISATHKPDETLLLLPSSNPQRIERMVFQ